MPRAHRRLASGRVYHIFNRGVRRLGLFATDDDYLYFQQLMGAAQRRTPLPLLGYCLMPNHWHLVVWPNNAKAVPAYMRWLTWSHSCHFNAAHSLSGHAYQGRYRSVVVRDEVHLLTLLRYVEGNAARAGLVERAEDWRWSSLNVSPFVTMDECPVPRPPGWLDLLGNPEGCFKVPGTVKGASTP